MGQLTTLYTFRYGGAVGDLLIQDPRRRLIAVLLRLVDCRRQDSPLGLPIRLCMTQLQLAQCANMSRQLVGPLLQELEGLGDIVVGYREVTVQRTSAMRQLLEQA